LFISFNGNFRIVINPLRYLNVKPEEQTKVLLMLAMGFFIGIFVATYQVTSESLFLNRLSAQLNKAFLISGGLGIAITLIFSFFQSRVRFIWLVFFSLVLIFITTLLLNYFYRFGNIVATDNILMLMYCLTGPITALLLLCYWGMFSRLFNFRQSKRIISWIDTGQLVAIILANFLIPLSASLFPKTIDYLLVCNISIVGVIVCLGIITSKFDFIRQTVNFDKTEIAQTRFSRILRDKYVVLLSVFLIVSVVTLNFSQFIFQNILNKQFPAQRDLTDFLAYFNGAIYTLSLVMQVFLNDRIIGTYGLRVSLFIMPIVTGLFATTSFAAALFFGYDFSVNPETVIYFFLFVALTRLFNTMLRDSLENPVYKLMFVPLDSRHRFGIQTKVEGVVSETGRLIAGILIFSLSLFSFFEIIWIPLFIVAFCAIYFGVIQRLYVGYKNKIRSKLETKNDNDQQKLDLGAHQVAVRLEKQLEEKDTPKAVFAFRLLEKLQPSQTSSWINSLMKNTHEEAHDYAVRRMNEFNGLSVSDRYVIRANNEVQNRGDKKLLNRGDLQSILASGGDVTKQRIQSLARSPEANDRQYAAELMLHSSDENASFLVDLLTDVDLKVRKTAIFTSIKINNQEVIFALISNLSNPIFSNQAMGSLVLIGEKALHHLENAFYRSGESTQTVIRIVQVIGRIGGQQAKDLLWSKIDFPDKVVVSQVLVSLGECGFKAGISQITRIKYAIENDIADIAWNLNAIQSLGGEGYQSRMLLALTEENANDVDHIYMLLAMLYDASSIQLVKENIESGTSEGTTYAVELLDVFLSEQLKEKVIPVLDELPLNEKINRLEAFYPANKIDSKLTLKFLINRDFTQSNRWTKACAMAQIGVQKIYDFKLDLIAHLFNPDLLLSEMAGWALFQIDPQLYESNSKRLPEDIKRQLDAAIVPQRKEPRLRLFEKIVFFRTLPIFSEISGMSLSYLADMSREIRMSTDEFTSIDEKVNGDFFIVFRGSFQYYENSRYLMDYNVGQFIGERVSPAGFANSNLLITKEPSILLKINKDQFYELLADNVKLADKVLEHI
jgi:ATP:ADP antiporter, AAA family